MRVWVDLDNAPHVPFFRPLIAELGRRGCDVSVTIRDFGFTRDLAETANLEFDTIGSHPGAAKAAKVIALATRAAQLAGWARRRRPDIAVSHGSRGLVAASWLLRIPSVTMFDYEFVSSGLFERFSTRLLLPDALDRTFASEKAHFYNGYKEEVYLGGFEPDPHEIEQFGIPEGRTIFAIRPPATMAHYHDSASELLFHGVLDLLSSRDDVFGVIAPRTSKQGAEIAGILRNPLNFHILERPVDGLNLIWHADVVIGGGGTMNREAAVLGVPVYSIFTGPLGAIDARLSAEGRMRMLRSPEDVTRIKVQKRDQVDIQDVRNSLRSRSERVVGEIVDHILGGESP